MDEQKQNDQLETTYSSSVPIRDVPLMTYRKHWTIGRGGDRWSDLSMLIARHDDDYDDDDDSYHIIQPYLVQAEETI